MKPGPTYPHRVRLPALLYHPNAVSVTLKFTLLTLQPSCNPFKSLRWRRWVPQCDIRPLLQSAATCSVYLDQVWKGALTARRSTASLCSSARRQHRGCLCTLHAGKQPRPGSWGSPTQQTLWSVPNITSFAILAMRYLWYGLFKATTNVMESKQKACLFCYPG